MAKNGFTANEDRYGMILFFKTEIDVTQAHLTISFETLVTRIGGILGVGRTLTWLLNNCIDYLSFAYQNLTTRALNVKVSNIES